VNLNFSPDVRFPPKAVSVSALTRKILSRGQLGFQRELGDTITDLVQAEPGRPPARRIE
jgi:hypothetical protein